MSMDRRDASSSGPGPLERLFARGVFALGVLGTGLILLLAALIITDVVGREVFGRAVPGVPELVAMSMVSIVFLQLSHALRSERLTRNGSFIDRLCARRPALGHALETFFSLAGAVVFGMIVYTTLPFLAFAWTSNQFSGGMAGFFVPVWPVKAVTVVGSLAITVQFLLRARLHLRLARKGKSAR